MSEPTLTSRERRLLSEVTALLSQRAERQEAIEKQRQEQAESADRAHRRDVEEAEAAFLLESERVEGEATEIRAALARRLSEESAAAAKQRTVQLAALKERASHDDAAARKKLQDAVWLAESIYDTSKDRPRVEHEAKKKEIDAVLAQAAAAEKEAGQWLLDHRQRAMPTAPAPGVPEPGPESMQRLVEAGALVQERLKALDGIGSARLLAGANVILPPIVMAGLFGAAASWTLKWRIDGVVMGVAGVGAVVGVGVVFWLLGASRRRTGAAALSLAEAIAQARSWAESAREHAATIRKEQEAANLKKRDAEVARAKQDAQGTLQELRQRIEQETARISAEHEKIRTGLERAGADGQAGTEKARAEGASSARDRRDRAFADAERAHQQAHRELNERFEAQWRELREQWTAGMARADEQVHAITRQVERFTAWSDPTWSRFAPSGAAPQAVPLGRLHVDLASMPGGMPDGKQLPSACPPKFDLPASLQFPDRASLLIQTGPEGRAQGVRVLQNAVLRLLTAFPPGKVRFTLIDPVGLGQNFAGFMHLSDYEEAIVGDKIWTEPRHIEQKLTDLTEHMEDVIQKYLRNEYATIDEYNEQAGEVAEPFRFLVLADFPANLTEQAAKRLASIVASGPRCGVYTLILADARQKPPQGLHMSDLEKAAGVRLVYRGGRFCWEDPDFAALPLTLEDPPEEAAFTGLIHALGESLKDSTRVQVPFSIVAPEAGQEWTRASDRDISVPIGRAGASKLQHLTLGRGTAQHALIAGRTGSGKSTLLHAIITSAALWYGPDQVELYLVDFKKGVEFKTYATHALPHARVIAIESEREFGLSVLRRLDAELKRRGNLFRDLGVQDLAGFRAAQPGQAMPRVLLIVDEFQELFVEDDKLAQESSLLLDRLVRQGRAFGMHVVLGSQTLGGAYSLARSTIGQMAVRIALQCSEADAYLIMSDDNSAPRLLSRPGEAIYNDASGAVEGNSPFQVVWLPDEQRDDYLGRVEHAKGRSRSPVEEAIVFEGNVPADVARFRTLAALLDSKDWPARPPAAPRVWLGEPVSIKDATAAALRRQSGANVLIVGQKDESALAMLTVGMIGLAAQDPPVPEIEAGGEGGMLCPRFIVLDGTPADVPHAGLLTQVAGMLPHRAVAPEYRDAADAIAKVHAEVARRKAGEGAAAGGHGPGVYLFIHGLQRFRVLRKKEDDFGFAAGDDGAAAPPDRMFAEILADGPALGVHTVVWCDTVTNLDRTLQRNSLREFDVRVLFQMSSTDSSSLIDGPSAGLIGQNRALFHSEEQGVLEKFRPWAVPPEAWLARVHKALSGRRSAPARA